MEQNQLSYFVTAAKCLNFSEAAKKHFITQPTISHSISTLEAELGVALFNRIGRSVTLTSEGCLFLKDAEMILSQMDDAVKRVRLQNEGRMGSLTISLLSLCREVFFRCRSALFAQFPDIKINLSVPTGNEQSQVMQDGAADLYFTTVPLVKTCSDMYYFIPRVDRFYLLAPKVYLDSDSDISLNNLYGKPFISIDPYSAPLLHYNIMSICRARGFEPNIIDYVSTTDSIMMCVQANLGITILPYSLIKDLPMCNVIASPIDGDDATLETAIAWSSKELSTTAELFVHVIRDLYADKQLLST